MKILRLTGHFRGNLLDVRLTTDAINNSDERFNIQQIQVGTNYEPSDINNPVFQGRMGNLFKIGTTTTLTSVLSFARVERMNVSIMNTDGSGKQILFDAQESSSASI